MADPEDALTSFQQALLAGQIKLRRGVSDPNLFVFIDQPHGHPRMTYVRLTDGTVTAFVEFVLYEPIGEDRCCNIGYAVPEAYRGQGRASEAVEAAISDLQIGLGRQGIRTFWIEAVVGTDNRASQRVAEEMISDAPIEVTDHVSGQSALQYLRRVELD